MALSLKSQEEDTKINTNNSMHQHATKPPLLFFLGELSGETKHALFDPIQRTFKVVEYPELGYQTECLCSGHGWILLLSRETSTLFFFNPLTGQKFDIPYRNSIFNAVTFSAPPTSPNCTVFAMETSTFINGQTTINTFCVGQEEKRWIRHVYQSGSLKFNFVVQLVCRNGILYCVDSHGRISTFDIEDGSWNVIPCKKAFKSFFYTYLVEYNGEIFAGKRGPTGVLEKLYKLKVEEGVADWEEVKDMGDITLFLGPYGCCAMPSSLIEGMEKKVAVARDNPEAKYVVYNFDGRESKIDKSFDATSYSWWYAPVWIDGASNSH